MSVIYTLLIFSVIIFIHELGHFVVARMCGVRVIEFSLGMGPAIFKYQGKETLYALRILPIGGYAAMEGENGEFGEFDESKLSENATKDDDENTDETLLEAAALEAAAVEAEAVEVVVEEDEVTEEVATEVVEKNSKTSRSFSDKTVIQKILICVAGPVMNLVLAFVIITGTLVGADSFSTTTIAGFKENSRTDLTGLKEGDKITKVNGVSIYTDRDIVYEILRDRDSGGVFDMDVLRDGNNLSLKGVTFNVVEPEPDENGEIDPNAIPSIVFDFFVESDKDVTFFKTLKRGYDETFSLARSSVFSLVDLVAGKVPFSELSGPVGVGQVVGEAAKMSFATVLNLAAMISVSIGILNLAPFPALDGGRIVFYSIEGITGKPISPKIEGYVNGVGMLILLTMMVAVTFKDITALF